MKSNDSSIQKYGIHSCYWFAKYSVIMKHQMNNRMTAYTHSFHLWQMQEKRHRTMRGDKNDYLTTEEYMWTGSWDKGLPLMIIGECLYLVIDTISLLSRITEPIYLKLDPLPFTFLREGRSIDSSSYLIDYFAWLVHSKNPSSVHPPSKHSLEVWSTPVSANLLHHSIQSITFKRNILTRSERGITEPHGMESWQIWLWWSLCNGTR